MTEQLDPADLALAATEEMDGAIFVTTMSSIGLIDAVPGDRLVFPAVAMMGAASTFGLGLAMAQPDRDVVVLDGDGSLLMELGSLVTIADASPANLVHVILNNGVWFHGTADLPVPGRGEADFCALATAAGYRATFRVRTAAELRTVLRCARAAARTGPVLVDVPVRSITGKAWGVDNPQPVLPDPYFSQAARGAARLAKHLEAKGPTSS